jgi:hypothetical protein
MMQRKKSESNSRWFLSLFSHRRATGETHAEVSGGRDPVQGDRVLSTPWLCVPVFLSFVLGLTISISAAQGQPQDQSQEKSTTQKEKVDKTAKKQSKAQAAANLPAVIWHDPGDIASLDLINGAGGAEHAPRPDAEYVFVKEDMNGTATKFYVKDDGGVEWLVKVGEEAKPETAATRIFWAMGYFTDEDYFVPKIHVSKVPKLHRGNKDVASDGTVMNVRLKRQGHGLKKIQNWDWYTNPFLGTREFNGLRVMIALVNDWDLTAVNNKIYATDTERHYLVSDLGASMGKTGAVTTRSKGTLKDFEDSKFIRERKSDEVSFEMRTRPSPILAPFEAKNFEKRSRMEKIEDNIPAADVAWIGSQLAKLTPQQIRDAFRAAGLSADEVEGYARAIEKRIAELNTL